LFPLNFPDSSEAQTEILKESLILELEELVNPDDRTLVRRKQALLDEIRQRNRPPKLTGPRNDLDSMRLSFRDNLIAMQLEGLPVSSLTPSYDYWGYMDALKRKYEKSTPKPMPTNVT